MVISGLIKAVTNLLNIVRPPLAAIPGFLLLCTAFRRPGISSIIMSVKTYADMHYVKQEYDEIVKKFVYNILNRFKLNLQDKSVCFIIIPPGELILSLTSGNVGGPLVLNGTNLNYVFAWGIIR